MNTDKIYAEAIANEYAPKDHSKVVALKKLDWKAKSKAIIFAYTVWHFDDTCFGYGNVSVYGSHRQREYLYDSDRNDDWFHWHSRC